MTAVGAAPISAKNIAAQMSANGNASWAMSRPGAFSPGSFSNLSGVNSAYTDLNSLQQIKQLDKHDPKASIDAVAKQFESLFLHMMLKSMRKASEGFSEGNFLNSNETRFHQDMLDQQLSVTLSQGQGVGLAEVIKRQLSGENITRPTSTLAADQANTDKAFAPIESYLTRAKLAQARDSLSSNADDVVNVLGSSLQKMANAVASKVSDISGPEDFIARLLPAAEKVALRLGLDVRALLAQAALETGWGKSVSGANSHNNLFGIKAGGDWQGRRVDLKTLEFKEGLAVKERAQFRAYASMEDSIEDYARFIEGSPRYEKALQHVGDSEQYFQSLQDAGYATDPHYMQKIKRIMDGDVFNAAFGKALQAEADFIMPGVSAVNAPQQPVTGGKYDG